MMMKTMMKMRMPPGFGCVEQDFEDQEMKTFSDFCDEEYRRQCEHFVTDEFIESCRDWAKVRTQSYEEDSQRYRYAENPPERYSTYSLTIIHDASHVVGIFRFLHIHRRHPMSPDGWACCMTEDISLALDVQKIEINEEDN